MSSLAFGSIIICIVVDILGSQGESRLLHMPIKLSTDKGVLTDDHYMHDF